MRLYVGSLHCNITKEMLRGIFEPFGKVGAEGWGGRNRGRWDVEMELGQGDEAEGQRWVVGWRWGGAGTWLSHRDEVGGRRWVTG